MKAIALALFCLTGIHGANLILNPSFESNALGSPGADLGLGSGNTTALPNWTVTGACGSCVSVIRDLYTEAFFGFVAFPAQDGQQHLDLTGAFNTLNGGVEQLLTLVPTTSYTMTFWVGNQDDGYNGYAGPSSLEVFLNGTSQGTFINALSTAGQTTWQQFSLTFTAAIAPNTIRFTNATPFGNNYVGLDNIFLDQTPVPEPSTTALAGAALVALGWIGRRTSKGRTPTRPGEPSTPCAPRDLWPGPGERSEERRRFCLSGEFRGRWSAMKLLLACMVAAGILPAANLLINGSFETITPSIPLGTGVDLAAGNNTTLNGWTVVGTGCGPCIGAVNGIVTEVFGPAVTYGPADGNGHLDIVRLSNPGVVSGIEQTIALVAGAYELSFQVGRGSPNHPSFLTPSAVEVLINGISQGTFINADVNTADPNANAWKAFNFNFAVTTAQPVTITFLHANPLGNHYVGLDGVSLAAVPEPSTFVLAGAACLLLWRRHQGHAGLSRGT